MKTLRRNLKTFDYRGYAGSTEVMADGWKHTGQYEIEYAPAVRYRGNISEPRGNAVQQLFGKDVNCTHVLVMDDPKADITVHGQIDWNGDTYTIMAVRPSINVLSVALRRETKTESEM